MNVAFVKKGGRRYGIEVGREQAPDLWCGTMPAAADRACMASVRACRHVPAAPV